MASFVSGLFGRKSNTPETQRLETQAPTPPVPKSRPMNSKRLQSLSKMFNHLPETVPNIRQIHMDVIEYICHCMLLENDSEKAWKYSQDLVQAIEGHTVADHGRLYSRLQIASYLTDFLGLVITNEDILDENEDQRMNSLDVSSDMWHTHLERLQHLKGILLRQDANVSVRTVLKGYVEEESILETKSNTLNYEFEKHEMFQHPYTECIMLLRLQKAMSTFRERAEDVINAKSKSPKTEQFRSAIDEYERDIATIVFEQPVANPERKHLPEDLVSFLPDLPNKPGNKLNNIITKCLDDMDELLLSSDVDYSHDTLVKKIRDLLLNWSEVTLNIPTLFELGYGGVSAPVEDKNGVDDDISSIGDNKEESMMPSNAEDVEELIKIQQANITLTAAEKHPRRPSLQGEDDVDDAIPAPETPQAKEARAKSYKQRRYSNPPTPETAQAKAIEAKKRTFQATFDEDFDEDEEVVTPRPLRTSKRNSTESQGFMDTPAPPPPLEANNSFKRDGTPRTKKLDGTYRKRREFWTDTETQCLINGWMFFGKGRWYDIRSRYDPLLENRNVISLSDRYRVLCKKGILTSGEADDENWKRAHQAFDENEDAMYKLALQERERRRKADHEIRLARLRTEALARGQPAEETDTSFAV